MQEILDGIEKFQTKLFPFLEKRFRQLASGQQPHTLFITCCDSRVVPHIITAADPGELFVCRTIGNIVPPHGSEDKSVASAVEYAVNVLEVSNIVICGHSDCGAMKGLLHPENLGALPETSTWLKYAQGARHLITKGIPEGELLNSLIEENVITQLENLKTHPAVLAKSPHFLGLVYDISSGSVREAKAHNVLLAKGAA